MPFLVGMEAFRKRVFCPALALWALTLILVLGASGCQRQRPPPPSGSLLSVSDCRSAPESVVPLSGAGPGQTCVRWKYHAGTLNLTHVHAAFNCCSTVSVVVDVRENLLEIRESESGDMCHCLCLKDVAVEVRDLVPGTYRVVVIETSGGGDPPLSFVCDLATQAEGEYCVPRPYYPWATEEVIDLSSAR